MMTKKRSLDEIAADIKALLGSQPRPERAKAKPRPKPTVKRGLPNQHGRLSRSQAYELRFIFGDCPCCNYGISNNPLRDPAVIYRRSQHSVTFRCNVCRLQWTITWANIHRAASAVIDYRRSARKKPIWDYEAIAQGTKFAAEREIKRKSSITRQTRRRAIRLPDRSVE
jgi:hypothetical protein